jgi:branched-chain amino acid transport system permease protein
MEYILHILILIGIYAILGISLNLIAGYLGLLSVGQAAFFGIGAYAVGLATVAFGTSVFFGLLIGIILAGILGAIVAWPSLRIHDDYFVVATLAFQVLVFSILNNWISLTRGPMGIVGIPPPSVFGFEIGSRVGFMVLIWVFVALTMLFVARIVHSPYGRVLKTIREDEVLAQVLGKNIVRYKVQAFIVSAALAAISGGLYASYISFIDPTSFNLGESIFILAIVIVGGAGSLWGPVLGAALLISLPEALRFFDLPTSVIANIRQILYGGILVGFTFWRPQGLIGETFLDKAGNK